MPPEAAVVETPNVSTPGVAPTEKPKAAPRAVRAADFAKQFEAKAAELGGLDDAEEPEAATETKAEPAAADTDKPNGKPKKPPATPAKPEDGPVTASERIAFSEVKRKHEAWYREKQAEIAKLEQETTSKHGERITKAEKILAAIEAGDPDGFASAVGKKDFNEFQEEFIRRLADPNYTEVKKLKQQLEEREKREAEEKTNAEKQAEQRKIAEMRQGFIKDLGEKAKASQDKLAATMADDPLFLNTVYRIMEQNWSHTEQKTVTLEEALDRGVNGSKTSLREELRALHGRLNQVFGEPPALAAANGRTPAPRVAPRTAVTPARTTDAAGAAKKIDPRSREWQREAQRRLAEAKDD